MNKDQKLLAEAYEDIQFTRTFKEMSGRLNPTADLEKIAEFLNTNNVAGNWSVKEDGVVSDNVSIKPEKRGLLLTIQKDYGPYRVLHYWPVEGKYLNTSLQDK